MPRCNTPAPMQKDELALRAIQRHLDRGAYICAHITSIKALEMGYDPCTIAPLYDKCRSAVDDRRRCIGLLELQLAYNLKRQRNMRKIFACKRRRQKTASSTLNRLSSHVYLHCIPIDALGTVLSYLDVHDVRSLWWTSHVTRGLVDSGLQETVLPCHACPLDARFVASRPKLILRVKSLFGLEATRLEVNHMLTSLLSRCADASLLSAIKDDLRIALTLGYFLALEKRSKIWIADEAIDLSRMRMEHLPELPRSMHGIALCIGSLEANRALCAAIMQAEPHPLVRMLLARARIETWVAQDEYI